MDTDTIAFCRMVLKRSEENRRAMHYLFQPQVLLSPAVSLLRQELDSMVRVIYLLSVKNLTERKRLIKSTLDGKKWKVKDRKGKLHNITDREMVDLAQKLHGWTQSVYKFGCAFIHLSDFHNYFSTNPFDSISNSEKQDILKHIRFYHGGPLTDNPKIDELAMYLPLILEKISDNLICYVEQLKKNKIRSDI